VWVAVAESPDWKNRVLHTRRKSDEDEDSYDDHRGTKSLPSPPAAGPKSASTAISSTAPSPSLEAIEARPEHVRQIVPSLVCHRLETKKRELSRYWESGDAVYLDRRGRRVSGQSSRRTAVAAGGGEDDDVAEQSSAATVDGAIASVFESI
jgi:hypothetical protein